VETGEIFTSAGGGVRTFGQITSLGVTALATVTVAVTMVLFFTTALIPLAVLWPVAIACGCAALIGLLAFAIVRHAGKEGAWESIEEMPSNRQMELWKRINSIALTHLKLISLDLLLKLSKEIPDAVTIVNVLFSIYNHYASFKDEWKRQLDKDIAVILHLLPFNLLMNNTFPEVQLGFSVYDSMFEYYESEDLRVDLLNLLRQRFTAKQLREIFHNSSKKFHNELVSIIKTHAGNSKKIQKAWNNLLKCARLKDSEAKPIREVCS
jgi:hypothetical protein